MRFALGMLIAVLVSCSASVCLAQRRGPSPERFFRMLDQDGDGMIRGNEWDRIPPLRGMLDEMEIDPERGMKLEEFESLSGEMMQRMRDRGGFRGPRRSDDRGGDERRDRGGFGRGPESDRSRPDPGRRTNSRSSSDGESNDRDSERRRGRRGEDQDSGNFSERRRPSREFRRQRNQESQNARRGNRRGDSTDNKRQRVTLTLPAEYASRDKNRDGQVGLYEWPQTDFAAFASLDHNGDGFLTPRELQRTDRPASNTTTVVSVAAASPRSSRATAKPVSRASSTTGSSKYQKAAEFAFRALDRDKDGVVAVTEWKRSRSTRPLFEKGGVDISQTMSREDFIANYVRLRSK